MNPLDSTTRLIRRTPAWARWLRGRTRSSEVVFVLVAIAVGGVAGLLAIVQGVLAQTLQHLLYGLPPALRLSGVPALSPIQLALLPMGGLCLVLFKLASRARRRSLVDAVEANALHGGRMSAADSLVISGQTLISNGFGASVGLEAAYAQIGGAIASLVGGWLSLRRGDVRTLVGAGAGAAIAATFGAPLVGAFYAFEIVIGAYTPAAIAPVAAASLAGAQVAQGSGWCLIWWWSRRDRRSSLPAICSTPGWACLRRHRHRDHARRGHGRGTQPRLAAALGAAGGWRVLLIPIAMLSPQVLSAGHSALHADLPASAPLMFIATIILAKSLASVISLGFGFRGGLFFASLFLGTLVGHLYADFAGTDRRQVDPRSGQCRDGRHGGARGRHCRWADDGGDAGARGDGQFQSDWCGARRLAGSSTIVRETFGYSFSTWRLHLRGETIKSARDVGWVRTLTAGRMMRRDLATIAAATTVAEFRRRFPLGATSRVALLDECQRYAGIVTPAAVYAEGVDEAAAVAGLAHAADIALSPEMHIGEIMALLDRAQTDELVVLDKEGGVLGVISENFVSRRYADELEKAQRELFGEA